jgi:hypothetical protein
VKRSNCSSSAACPWPRVRGATTTLRESCSENAEKGLPTDFPVREETIISFVLWLAFKRGVCSATISNYLAGMRNAHIVRGLECPKLRSEKVELLLRGKKN